MYGEKIKNTNKQDTFHLLRRSLKYLKPYWFLQLICFLVVSVVTVLSLVQPWINKLLIDNVLIAGDIRALKLVCALFFGTFLLQAGLSILQSYIFAKIGGGAVLDLRIDLYNHLQILSLPFFRSKKTGEIMALFTSDIARMQGLYTSTIVSLITDTLRLVTLLIVMFLINSSLTLIAVLCLPFYGYFILKISKPIRHTAEHVQEQRAKTTGELQERISGIREIKAFIQEITQSKSMASSFRNLYHSIIRLTVIGSLGNIAALISAVGFVLIIWFGGKAVISGTMLTGVFIAFIGYMAMLFKPVNTFVFLNRTIQAAMGAAKRVFHILDERPDIETANKPIQVKKIKGIIEFRNVNFSYNSNERTLNNISLKIFPGQSVGLVGASGSGKTTIAMLLLRFFDPDEGAIFIDEHNLRELELKDYRRHIGVVFQDPFLFDMSVKENISFGNPGANENAIEQAAKAAYAYDFISRLPAGFNTVIGERGVTLSGGQQQRIAIARAILKCPDLVILDEATSALDTESERLVQKAMNRLLNGRTSVIIAHRISTIRNADKIVILEEGKLIEEGKFEDLLRIKGRFWQLYNNV